MLAKKHNVGNSSDCIVPFQISQVLGCQMLITPVNLFYYYMNDIITITSSMFMVSYETLNTL
jgi:hypothetical protein